MSVAECQARVSSEEFAEWQVYYTLEPWGEWRADLRAGIIAAASVSPYTKRRITPKDFMPKFERKANKRQTVEEQKSMLAAFAKE